MPVQLVENFGRCSRDRFGTGHRRLRQQSPLVDLGFFNFMYKGGDASSNLNPKSVDAGFLATFHAFLSNLTRVLLASHQGRSPSYLRYHPP